MGLQKNKEKNLLEINKDIKRLNKLKYGFFVLSLITALFFYTSEYDYYGILMLFNILGVVGVSTKKDILINRICILKND